MLIQEPKTKGIKVGGIARIQCLRMTTCQDLVFRWYCRVIPSSKIQGRKWAKPFKASGHHHSFATEISTDFSIFSHYFRRFFGEMLLICQWFFKPHQHVASFLPPQFEGASGPSLLRLLGNIIPWPDLISISLWQSPINNTLVSLPFMMWDWDGIAF